MKDSIYLANVVSFDTTSGIARAIIPQLFGQSIVPVLPSVRRQSDIPNIIPVAVNDTIMVFFEGGDETSPKWLSSLVADAATTAYFDARYVNVTGGDTMAGQLVINAPGAAAANLVLGAEGSGGEGGQLNFNGAPGYATWFIDNYTGLLRFWNGTTGVVAQMDVAGNFNFVGTQYLNNASAVNNWVRPYDGSNMHIKCASGNLYYDSGTHTFRNAGAGVQGFTDNNGVHSSNHYFAGGYNGAIYAWEGDSDTGMSWQQDGIIQMKTNGVNHMAFVAAAYGKRTESYAPIWMQQNALYLYNNADTNHGIEYSANTGGVGWDGPYVHGYTGGALGTIIGVGGWCLGWKETGRVYVRNGFTVNAGGADINGSVVALSQGQLKCNKQWGGTYYYDQSVFVDPGDYYGASNAGISFHVSGTAPQMFVPYNTNTFKFVNSVNSAWADIEYGAATAHSMRSSKQDIEPWPKKMVGVGAAVNEDFATESALDIANRLKPSFFRWKEDAHLHQIPTSPRRSQAYARLSKMRTDKGLGPWESDETVHLCGRDCEGTPEQPCTRVSEWQRGQVGFIADEVHSEFPLGIKLNEDGEASGINPMALIALLTKAVQELTAKVALLEAR